MTSCNNLRFHALLIIKGSQNKYLNGIESEQQRQDLVVKFSGLALISTYQLSLC